MNKQKFLAELRKGLFGLPQDDIEERLTFYSEMLDDIMKNGEYQANSVSTHAGSCHSGKHSTVVPTRAFFKIPALLTF